MPDVWDELRTSHPINGPSGIGPAEVVADLSELDGPPESRSRRVAVTAVQGFLAVHQAGGFVALIRPFARPGAGHAYFDREPVASSPAAPAFDPVVLPGGRRMLLADRRMASVIDTWDTEISAAFPSRLGPRRLVPPAPIAAAPVPLGESKVGMVLGAAAPYSWMVWDPDVSPESARAKVRPLPIVGAPCEASLVAGEVLTLATPEGHWAWRIADASAGRVEAIRSTWSSGSDGLQVKIDRRAENAEAFASPSQIFLASEPGGPFYWHFRTNDGRARSYRVNLPDLATDDRFDYDGTAPVGLAQPPGQARRSMIFEKRDRLYEERDIRGQLAPCQVSLPGEGSAGLQLVGTLIVTIGNARDGVRPIRLQSLWGSHPSVSTEEIAGLASDPFVWSGHMFTVERPKDGLLTLVRRALIDPREVPT